MFVPSWVNEKQYDVNINKSIWFALLAIRCSTDERVTQVVWHHFLLSLPRRRSSGRLRNTKRGLSIVVSSTIHSLLLRFCRAGVGQCPLESHQPTDLANHHDFSISLHSR